MESLYCQMSIVYFWISEMQEQRNPLKTSDTYRGNERLAYQHPKDICKGNRLPCGLLAPQGMYVVSDVFGKE